MTTISRLHIDRALLPPKLFYFGWFLALGTFSPFIVLYYHSRSLSDAQVGLLLALPGAAQIVAGPLWGLLADVFRFRRLLLPLAVLGSGLAGASLGAVAGYGPILALAACLALFNAAVAPLADSATLALLGERRERYGAQRVWGAVGWGATTAIAGVAVQRLGLPLIFTLFPLATIAAASAAALLPPAALPPRIDLLASIGLLLRDRRWSTFLGGGLLIGCASSLLYGFLPLYLQRLGGRNDQVGLSFAIGSISEIPMMALSPLLLARFAPRTLLTLSGCAYALRMLIFVFAPNPEVILAAQLLHGPCFALLWTAGVLEAQRIAPPGLATTGQSLFSVAVFGVATVIANLAAGVVVQVAGFHALFGGAAVIALCGAAVLRRSAER